MIEFLATYDYLFYWSWFIIFSLRGFLNHYIFSKRGDTEMEAYSSIFKPNHLADIMTSFTFWFDEDETDSESLRKKVKLVNMLHIGFAVYSSLLFIMLLVTYGK